MDKSNKIVNEVDEELRQSIGMLSTIYDLNPDAIVLTRVDDGEIIDCNQEYLNQIGYSREEVIGHNTLELNLYSSKVRNAYLEEIKKKNTVTNFELRIKRKDDIFINVLYSAKFITVNSEKILLNIGKNITNRKQAAETIQQQAELIELSFDAIIVGQSDGIIESWNRGAEELYGYSKSEAIGKPTYELLNTIFPVPWSRIQKEIYDGGIWEGELKHHTKNGQLIIVSSRIQLIKRDDGSLKLLETNRDITDHKRYEEQKQKLLENEQQLTEELQTSNEELQAVTEELQVSNEELQKQRNELENVNQSLLDSERRMNISQEIAHLGGWELDIENNCLFWSDEVYRIFGLQPQEFDATYEAFLDYVHPDDRTAVDEAYSGSVLEGRDTYQIEHRVVRKSTGEVRFVHEKCEHFKDGYGRIVRSVGMVQDITERKMAEEALVESEAKFHSLYSSMSEGVAIHKMIYNPQQEAVDYIITDVNQAYEDITGFKKNDVVGKKASELYGKGNAPYLEKYTRVAENGEPIHFETYFEPMDKFFKITVTSPEKGLFATFFEDITEQEKVGEALRESEERFRDLADNIPNLAWMAEADGWIFWYNKQWYEYTGTTLDEMQGWGWQKVHHPDYVKPVTEEWSTCIKEGKPYDNIFPLKGKDGKYHWFLTRITPIRDDQGRIKRWFGTNTDITERKEIEAELSKYRDELENLVDARTVELEDAYESLKVSKEHYLTLFNSIDEGFCTIEVIFDDNNNPIDYRFLEVNPAFEGQTGLIEAKGKLMRDLEPDIEEQWFEIYGKIALTGKPKRFVNESKALNRWYDVYAFKIGAPESRKVAVLFNDITKFKKTEEALELSSRYNRSLIEASLDPLVTIGPEGKITDVNKSTEIITGYSKDDLIGTDFSDYFTDPEKARSGYKKVFREGSVHDYSLEIKSKSGVVTPVLYNAAIYKDNSGEVIGVFAAARDITQMKNIENKLKEYQDTLEEKVKKRTEELAKSNAELEHFAYVASHDLREPLRMITSFLQLLERRYSDNLDHDAKEFIGFAVDGAKRLDEMINDLLEYSKVTRQEQVFKPVKLEKVLEEALINLIVPTEEHNAIIGYDPLPTVYGDERLLVQLFQNLIGNAIKYHDQKPPKIHISSTKENNQYIISIKDNGIGIDSQHLDRIFTIFQRLHRNDEYEGTGIGLAIAQKIVHQHGGEIWAESEKGKGTIFFFTLPF